MPGTRLAVTKNFDDVTESSRYISPYPQKKNFPLPSTYFFFENFFGVRLGLIKSIAHNFS